MRIMFALAATAAFSFFASSAHAGGFVCAKPTVAQPLTDQDKEAIFLINQKIHDIKVKKGASYLGKQNGIMCNTPDGKGKFWHFDNGSVYWSPLTGAHAVVGLIRKRGGELNWEQGALGYPMTDEIDTYDGKAKVTKFQGGQLTWRPWTNGVTAAMISDLKVDLPSPAGQKWRIVQSNGYILDDPSTPKNEGDSHQNQWVYCYDMVAVDDATKGANYGASADAKIVLADQVHANDDSVNSNVVVQYLGLGRYASSLHIQQNSYSDTFGKGKPALTVNTPWADRPTAKSGDTIAHVGKTGTGGEHIHYCITTSPDRSQFAPFESVPFAFRNYEVLDGNSWKTVAWGRPEKGSFVRRKANVGGAANTKAGAEIDLLHFGDVQGNISLPAGKTAADGQLKVTVLSAWGEPLASGTATGTADGKFSYKLHVPDFTVTVQVAVAGSSDASVNALKGAASVMVKANQANAANVVLK